MPPTLERAARAIAERLASAGVPDPMRDAQLLARWAAGLDGAGYAARRQDPVSSEVWGRLEAAADARAERRPLSHIVGERWFYGRSFAIDGRALDPRPESEALVEAAAAHLRSIDAKPHRVLDLGVGSGCLLATVLLEIPESIGLGVDISAEALELTAVNIKRFGLQKRARLTAGDWLDGCSERFDAVLCNPPYIAESELSSLEPEVRLHEPLSALSPGADGLSVYRKLAPQVGEALTAYGAAFFEVGRGQAEAVVDMMSAQGLRTGVIKDLGGVDRIVTASRNLA